MTNKRTIVVTHHLPTFFNYPEKYRYSELKTAFATDLFDLIEQSNVDYWIFGHSHEIMRHLINYDIKATTIILVFLPSAACGQTKDPKVKFDIDKVLTHRVFLKKSWTR